MSLGGPEVRGRDDPLDQWLGLELRRARAAFDEARTAEDASIVDKAGKMTGVRVKAILTLAERVATALATSTLERVQQFNSPLESADRARARIADFIKEMSKHATAMSYYVQAGPSGLAVVDGRTSALQSDVDGAFQVALRPITAPRTAPVSVPSVEAEAAPAPRLGRRRRTGGYSVADARLVEKIHAKVVDEEVSPWAAALDIVEDAKGGGTIDSRAKRLVGRYYEKHPAEQG